MMMRRISSGYYPGIGNVQFEHEVIELCLRMEDWTSAIEEASLGDIRHQRGTRLLDE